MGAYIARQPNGKLCRFSTVVDTVTAYNMTDEEYIEMCVKRAADAAREDAVDTLKRWIRPFEEIKEDFKPTNNTIEEFQRYLKEMGDEEGLSEEKLEELREVENMNINWRSKDGCKNSGMPKGKHLKSKNSRHAYKRFLKNKWRKIANKLTKDEY